jgi:hypothetical protein
LLESVVLVVYGWKSVQPGTLSWAFPSLAAALHAAHAMSNAVKWAIVAGSAAAAGSIRAGSDLAKLRATGRVLLEQA